MSNELVEPGHYCAMPDALRLIPNSVLPPAAKIVWCTILDFQGKNDWAFPSQRTLAFKAGVSVSEVGKWTKQLEKLGLLEIRRDERCHEYRCKLPSELLHAARRIKTECKKRRGGFDYDKACDIREQALREWRRSLSIKTSAGALKGERSVEQTITLVEPNDIAPYDEYVCSPGRPEPLQESTEETIKETHATVVGAPAPTSPDTGDARRTPRVTHTSSRTKESGGALTDDEKRFILASPDAVKVYLNFGVDAMRQHGYQPLLDGIKNRTLNLPFDKNGSWAQHVEFTVDETGKELLVGHIDRWTAPQLAHWYWWHVANSCEANGQPISMVVWDKRRKGRLYADVAALVNSRTREKAYELIVTVVEHFDLIKSQLGRFGDSLSLDEAVLGLSQVRGIADRILSWTPEQIERAYAEMYKKRRGAA